VGSSFYKTLFVCRFTHEGMLFVSLRRRKENVMPEGRSSDVRPMTHNVDMVLDAHTHLTGSEEPEQILECLNACGVEKDFLFAPELDVASRRLTNDHLDDVRKHNDYCADVCSAAPDRLLGFCNLIPTPNLADGDGVHGDGQRPAGPSAQVERVRSAPAQGHGAPEPKVWNRETLSPKEGVLPDAVPLVTRNTVHHTGILKLALSLGRLFNPVSHVLVLLITTISRRREPWPTCAASETSGRYRLRSQSHRGAGTDSRP
jgi:hypothetical protein